MQSACAVLCCHLWPLRLHHIFPHYLTKAMIFVKTLLNIKCVLWFSLQLVPETCLILRRIQRDIIVNIHESSCKYSLILLDFKKLEISRQFLRNIQVSNFMKIRPLGDELFHADEWTDRQADMSKVIIAFRNFSSSLKIRIINDIKVLCRYPEAYTVRSRVRIPSRPVTTLIWLF